MGDLSECFLARSPAQVLRKELLEHWLAARRLLQWLLADLVDEGRLELPLGLLLGVVLVVVL